MKLRDLFSTDVVKLDLDATQKGDALQELVDLLGVDDRARNTIFRTLRRREKLGSTGIGKGIAIPHCRSLVVSRLHLAFGRSSSGLDFDAIDGGRVHHLFLIVAPPLEVSNQYLPVLGKIAQFAKEADVTKRLSALESADDFLELLEQRAP